MCCFFENALIEEWIYSEETRESNSEFQLNSISTDGRFLFVHNAERGLKKIGSGYGNTIKGHVYCKKENLTNINNNVAPQQPNAPAKEKEQNEIFIACLGENLYCTSRKITKKNLSINLQQLQQQLLQPPNPTLWNPNDRGFGRIDELVVPTINRNTVVGQVEKSESNQITEQIEFLILNKNDLTEEKTATLKLEDKISSKFQVVSNGDTIFVIAKSIGLESDSYFVYILEEEKEKKNELKIFYEK